MMRAQKKRDEYYPPEYIRQMAPIPGKEPISCEQTSAMTKASCAYMH